MTQKKGLETPQESTAIEACKIIKSLLFTPIVSSTMSTIYERKPKPSVRRKHFLMKPKTLAGHS